MNSSTSGWSTSRTTIFAARRVLPPDLIVPADASAPRMKETGPEILLRDDVRRGLRPELRELDTALLEGRAVPAGDDRIARLPLDLVERVAARDREEALHAKPGALLDDRVHDLLGRRFAALNLLDACHLPLPNPSLRLSIDRAAEPLIR